MVGGHLDGPDRPDSIQLRHDQVQQDDVGLDVHELPDRLTAVGGLAHQLDPGFGLQQVPDALADNRVIVGDQHPNPAGYWGTSSLIRVPRFGWLCRLSRPPIRAARSCRPRNPSPPIASTVLGLNPTPSSATSSSTADGSTRSEIMTFSAPECFSTLLSAS